MYSKLLFRGDRRGFLIIGDSQSPEQSPVKNMVTVFDPVHPVYNSLIVPVKYYINNYLNSVGYGLPLEALETDYFYYACAIKSQGAKIKSGLTELTAEVNRPEHKIILSMGSFVFKTVERILNPDGIILNSYSIKEMGRIFSERLEASEYPIHLPVLHDIANLKHELTKNFIGDYDFNYLSYFHFVGVNLGELLMKHKEEFEFVIPMKQ
ncbi:MAG TPA: hypothetical protein VGA29_01295 [Ignavibacteriaceae bacterium]|jgi:hypothetical protein